MKFSLNVEGQRFLSYKLNRYLGYAITAFCAYRLSNALLAAAYRHGVYRGASRFLLYAPASPRARSATSRVLLLLLRCGRASLRRASYVKAGGRQRLRLYLIIVLALASGLNV
jgi:hypothetical protein